MHKMSQSRPESNFLSVRVDVLKRIGYGMGHIFNDMCAAMGFTYSLIFFQKVLGFETFLAGIFMAIGQLADGLSTIFVGIVSDKQDVFWLCTRYGNRKTWHLIGTACVALTFPFIFMPCINCENSSSIIQMVYYCGFLIVLQFGWASVQISHLAMIPELVTSEDEHTLLTSIRCAT